MQKIIQKARDFNELVMFEHSIFSLPFIFIAMIVAADGWFGWQLLFMGVLAAVSARNFAMGVNRYADIEIDAKNPRTKNRPNVDGRISRASILGFIVLNGAIFIYVASLINELAFATSVPILFVLGVYSYFKRFSALAHIVLGISLGLAPIAGVIAVNAAVTQWAIILSLGVIFWVAGFDLLYSLQDIDFDKQNNLHSIPSKYGPEITLKISLFFHLLTILFWSAFVFMADLGLFSYLAVLFSIFMLGYEHYLVRKDFTQIDRAFFTVNGYLGIVFLVLVILDKVL